MRCASTTTTVAFLAAAVLPVGVPARADGPSQTCSVVSGPVELNANADVDTGNDNFPQVTADRAGTWVAVWQSGDDLGGTIGTDHDILFARSRDGGETWTYPSALNTNAASDEGPDDSPQITADGSGIWVAVWSSRESLACAGTDFDILFARSVDGGATWSDPAALNTNAVSDGGKDSNPELTTDGLGNWMAVWSSDEDLNGVASGVDIFFARSTDGGVSWTPPALLNSGAATDNNSNTDRLPQLATDSAGVWIAVWQSRDDLGGTIETDDDILFAVSTTDGVSWTAASPLNSNAAVPEDLSADLAPQLATDGAGVWVAVWYSTDPHGDVGVDLDIFYSRSTDNGASWSERTVLNTNATFDGAFDFNPQVTTDSAGRWVVAWETQADLGGPIGDDFDVVSALSTDDGASWTNPAPLNTDAAGDDHVDMRVQLTTDLDGRWVAVWESNKFVVDFDVLTTTFEFTVCTDCNMNNVPDEDDITFGFSDDCNVDLVPDECQLTGDVSVSWAPQVEEELGWDVGANWCPDLTPAFPDNDSENSYFVTIDGPDASATLNVSPTVSMLTLSGGATVEVNDDSGANVRVLVTDGDVVNDGVFRATDRERLFLDAPLIDQGVVSCSAGGVLEATDGVLGLGEESDKSILQINGARVRGGRARTIGTNSEIHLIGGAELEDVCVQGVVVPNGQAASFTGTIVNEGVLRVAPDGPALTFLSPSQDSAILSGNGGGDDCVRLGGQSAARLGDFKLAFTNASNHRIDGTGIVFGGVTNEGLIEANHEGGGHLILFPPGEKTNHGTLRASGNGVLRIDDVVTQSSTGRIEAVGGGVVNVNSAVEGSGTHLAQGGMLSLADGSSVHGTSLDIRSAKNDGPRGIVEVSGNGALELTDDVTILAGGIYRRDPDAAPQSVTASLEAATVVLYEGEPYGGQLILTDQMSLDVSGNLVLDGTNAVCSQPPAGARPEVICTPPILHIEAPANGHVSGNLELVDVVAVTVLGPRAQGDANPIILAGQFQNHSQCPASFDWACGGITLDGSDTQEFEVAGVDVGANMAGFVENFAMGQVEVGAGSSVRFEDEFDNDMAAQGDCTEALYVKTLVLRAGASVETHNCRIYYLALIDEGATVLPPSDPCSGIHQVEIAAPSIVHAQGAPGETRPFSGYIDPRRESDNGVDVNQGLDTATLVFDQPVFAVGGGAVNTASFEVTNTAGGTHSVTGVTVKCDSTYDVTFDPPAELQSWTTIRAIVQNAVGDPITNLGDLGPLFDEPDRVDIGFLPANIDQDGEVGPFDLLRFRQLVTGIFEPPSGTIVDFADTDRDGSVGPADLLCLRQLLSGTGVATRPWLFETIAPRP